MIVIKSMTEFTHEIVMIQRHKHKMIQKKTENGKPTPPMWRILYIHILFGHITFILIITIAQ